MKRRAKKYNKNKWLIHQVNHTLDNWAVGFLAGMDNCVAINLNTMQILEAIDPELADVIIDHRHKWKVSIMALCKDDFGCPYIKCDEISVSDSVTHTEMLPILNDAHSVLCGECNKKHLIKPAWIAYAGRKEFDSEKMMPKFMKVFDSLGGFEQ